MTSSLVRAATRVSLGWVNVYTIACRRGLRGERRAVIASDIWEQANDGDAGGGGERQLATDLLWRTMKGAPADVAWRVERGGLAVNVQLGLGRSAGIVLLLMIAIVAVGDSGFGAQVGGDEPYFTEEFPIYVNDLGKAVVHIGFSFAFAALMLVGSALMFSLLRAQAPVAALAGGIALAVAGALFLAETAFGIRLFTLAEVYRDNGGLPRDPVWFSARDAAATGESLGLFGLAAFSAGLVGFGLAYRRTSFGPDWIGQATLAAAGVMLVGVMGLIVGIDLLWLPFLLGALSVFAVVIVLGCWLTWTDAGQV